jgi:hypothetical protein
MIYYHHSSEAGSHPFPTFAEAVASAELELKEYRDNAGEGWADEAGYISVYKCRTETEDPEEDGLLVAQSLETILEERPDDIDEDGYSEGLGDHWFYDFDYLAEYNVTAIDPVACAEKALARNEEGLAEARFEAQTPRIGDEGAQATIRSWEGYVARAEAFLTKTRHLAAAIGHELDV